MPESLTSATVHGPKWSYASTIVNVVLQIGVTAVPARLLTTHVAYLLVMRLLTLSLTDLRRAYSVGLAAGVITGLALFGLHAGLTSLGWPAPAVFAVQVALGALCLLGTVTKARDGAVWQEVRWRLAEAGYRTDGRGVAGWVIRRMDALT